MAIPDYQTLMLPLLCFAQDEKEHRTRDAIDALADQFGLTEEDRSTLLPSGTQAVFTNRIGWARSYLKQAGLIESQRRGWFRITQDGLSLLKTGSDKINIALLEQYPSFVAFRAGKKTLDDQEGPSITQGPDVSGTPEDALASAYLQLRTNIETELLETVKQSSPAFFERLVIDLLVQLGYGGNRQDAARAVGKSGDGGIDGIINEDRLGLDVIYVQAKRWESTVGRPEIQKFAGALQGQRAKKGIFITTSAFSNEALEYARVIDTRIILIDGQRLVKLMVDANVGVSLVGAYEVKKIDSDYFEEG